MRRLATVVLFVGLVATAQWGTDPSASRASGNGVRAAGHGRQTRVDAMRAAMPLPRAVAVAPTPADLHEEARRLQAARRLERAARATAGAGADVWARLARCESGGNPRARSANGLYFGAFQFSLATWRSVGFDGNPAEHSYEVQLAAARRLQARSGWGQWPSCSRRLGLR